LLSTRFCRRGMRSLEPQPVVLVAAGRLQRGNEEAQPAAFRGTLQDSRRTQTSGLH